MLLYIEGCESQFFRFNRSMTYWYTMLSSGDALLANKYVCHKADENCSEKKFGILGPIRVRSTNFFAKKYAGRTRVGSGSDPKFFKKRIASVCKDEVV